ncbi:hypothetical protein RDWZM_004408 [Blomia tropicalis]|uniref:AAA+ ATPase domain-containing protein n=1 Tax=Blomia tropicalis TaxID=40697 RepID=A0A9Q0RRS5_BLOTA|nr:hypothetical protein RDWZM_004408 [Blomia tropicalis]
MSKRKSTNSLHGNIEVAPSSASKNRSLDALQLTQCETCRLKFFKKDINKHENICKNVNSLLDISFLCEKIALEHAFLCGWTLLMTPWVSLIGKGKVDMMKTSKIIQFICGFCFSEKAKTEESRLLLSPHLITYCKLNEGDHVSIEYVDKTGSIQKDYLQILSYDQLKSWLAVGLLKGSSNANQIFHNKDGDSPILRIGLNLTIHKLKSLNVEICKRKFFDPLYLLKSCSAIKRSLKAMIINGTNDEQLTLEINDNQFHLKMKCFEVEDSNSLPIEMGRLSLSSSESLNPSYLIDEKTKIIFSVEETESIGSNNDFCFSGYKKQIDLLHRLIYDPLKVTDNGKTQSESLPRTIILAGPTGTGKTLAMKEIFDRISNKMNMFKIHCSIFLSKTFEFDKLRTAFNNLIQLRPSLLFLDNLEDISSEKNQMEKKLVSWLKVLLDELPKRESVIIVAATSRPDMLDNSLRRPGRFDLEIEFAVPTAADRKLILSQLLKSQFSVNGSKITEEEIGTLAESAHGFTGADLRHLCELVALEMLNNQGSPTFNQFMETLSRIKPSIMREISLEKPNVRWADIGGLYPLRQLLEETVVWPVKHPEAFIRLGIEPPRGVLMYGPPGCCKTMIGKALANESGLNFFSIKGPELFSKWVGESERAIREMFRKARAAAPSILFFDEIDALAAERGQQQSAVGDRVLAQLLTEIDGVEKLTQVVIVAATNRPDIVDKALLRPGRLDSMVYVPLPDLATRREIFQIHTRRMKLKADGELQRQVLIHKLADQSEGYTGAEIGAVCQRAGLNALIESITAQFVTNEHFQMAFKHVVPRIPKEMIAFYDQFANGDQSRTEKQL